MLVYSIFDPEYYNKLGYFWVNFRDCPSLFYWSHTPEEAIKRYIRDVFGNDMFKLALNYYNLYLVTIKVNSCEVKIVQKELLETTGVEII